MKNIRTPIIKLFRSVSIWLAVAFTTLPASASGVHSIAIESGSGRLIKLSGAATNVYAADPKIVEVRPASADSLFVFGVAPGHTTVAATNAGGQAVGEYAIDVVPSGFAARSTRTLLSRAIAGDTLRVEPTGNGIAVSGTAVSPSAARDAIAMAASTLGRDQEVDNQLRVDGSIQVNLHVRIAEMSRTLARELGINWQSVNGLGTDAVLGVSSVNPLTATSAVPSTIALLSRFNVGGHGALDTVIDALSQDQLVKMLAEPNLTTLSGQPASFLVGGEFPIPVADQNNTITVEFKQYGISLQFVPTVMSGGEISLHVRPEVSQLTTQGAVTLSEGNSSIQIPALTVRRADTTVELGSGQSFAIAGLLQDSTTDAATGVPFLSNLPILGALFRSDSFQRNETELVIVVTPYVVRPVSTPNALHLPTEDYRPPNDIERLLLLRQMGASHDAATSASSPHVPGDAGFLVE